ncbi:MAG TPA: hypothetical protein VIL36_04970 [Acidimicrobiales bacterium]
MADDIEILRDVRVFGVTVEGADVHVDVYGGRSTVCAGIHFTFTDPRRRAEAVALLRRWEDAATPLTFTATADTITLQNDAALLHPA